MTRSKIKSLLNQITFGVEFETLRPYDIELGAVGRYHQGIAQDWLPKFGRSSWKAEHDSSIRTTSGYTDAEYISPVLKGAAGLENMKEVLTKLNETSHKVNNSCGAHIHIGLKSVVGNADADEVVAFITKLQQYFNYWSDGFFAQTGTRRDRSRWSNKPSQSILNYTKGIQEKEDKGRDDVWNLSAHSGGKYQALNISRVGSGTSGAATIEFRFPAGTLNLTKMLLHITSILFLVVQAWSQRNKTKQLGWTPYASNPAKAGLKAFKRIVNRMVRNPYEIARGAVPFAEIAKEHSPLIRENWDQMVSEGERLARKYDSRF